MIYVKEFGYNDLPDGITEKLMPGQVRIYENLGNGKTREGVPIYPTQFVPVTDSIMVAPGDWRRIAFVPRPVPEGVKRLPLGTIVFEPSSKGLIILNGNNAGDVLVDEYLQLSNHNASNPKRDMSKKPIFKLKDDIAKAKEDFDAQLVKAKLVTWAAETSIDELKRLLHTRGINATGLQDAVIRKLALEQAQKSPFEANKATNLDAETESRVRELFEAEVFVFSPVEKAICNRDKETFYHVEGIIQSTPKQKKVDMFVAALNTDKKLFDRVMKDIEDFR